MQSRWLQTTTYGVGLELQSAAVKAVQAGAEAQVFGLEHEPVITLGKRGVESVDLLQTKEQILDSEYQIYKTDRGGQATLHNPGQLVIYPVIDLKSYALSVRDYVCLLEKSTEDFLMSFGLESHRSKLEPGLFINGQKIAFFGVRIQKGVTSHGVSINIDNDLQAFQWIRNCGSSKVGVTSIYSETKSYVPLERAFQTWLDIFSKRLNMVKKPNVLNA